MNSIENVFEQLEEQGLVFKSANNLLHISIDASDYLDIKRLSKEMHRLEIEEAQSYAISNADNDNGYFDCDKYYQETFVSKGSGMSEKPNNHIEQQLPQQEISDEEIEKEIKSRYETPHYNSGFMDCAKWYREQLKQL